MLVDSHCHLDFDSFDEDRAEVMARARDAGVGTMLTICTRLSRFHQVLALAEADDRLYCSVGIHPHQVAEEDDAELDGLIKLSRHPKVIGIGETGLDYYYDNSPREAQRTSLHVHVRAARETGLPLIVHARDADEDMVAILKTGWEEGRFACVLHCFSSGRALAEAALELGFYISLSGIVTFRNADDLRAIARDIPLDRLLIETDAPFLAPVPMRGKRNEPAYVAHTAAAVAELMGVELDELARITSDNFFRLFAKAAPP